MEKMLQRGAHRDRSKLCRQERLRRGRPAHGQALSTLCGLCVRAFVLCALCVLCVESFVHAQANGLPAPGLRPEPGLPSTSTPAVLREVGFDQRLDEQLPLDAILRDENGHQAPLGQYVDGKPVVLALVYYDCPMLCTQVLGGLAGALKALSLEPGRDFTVVAVSFDPRETPAMAAARKKTYLARYGRPDGRGWHFLTGAPEAISRVTRAVGFRYVFDDRLTQFAHPAGIVVTTSRGRISRYLYGIEYAPRDLKLALVEASSGRIGSPVDQLLLYCYHYDPSTGRYGLVAMRLIRLGGAATVLALGTFMFVMWRRERRLATAKLKLRPTRLT